MRIAVKIDKALAAVIVAGFFFGGAVYFWVGDFFKSGTPAPAGNFSVQEYFPAQQNSSSSPAVSAENSEGGPTAAPEECVYYEDAWKFIGETKCVFGKIESVYFSSGGTVFFDFCSDYKTCPFTAVVFKSAAARFSDAKKYEGRTVRITGLLKTYQGRPEIILENDSQIEVE